MYNIFFIIFHHNKCYYFNFTDLNHIIATIMGQRCLVVTASMVNHEGDFGEHGLLDSL